MNWRNKKILVTGGNGFLGSRVVAELQKKFPLSITKPSGKDCDLRLLGNCKEAVKDVDVIFHLAANVGGIGLNQKKPGELFYDNLMMGSQLMHEAKNSGIEKFIALGTICSYPKFTPIPFSEDSIWNGYPEETNAPYGLAKKMLLVQSQAYRQQYDFHSIVVIPTNLYGPNDNFNPSTSHVIPALILKMTNALRNNLNEIDVWGDGSPTRDFLFVDDAAKGIVLAAEKYDDNHPLNLGSGEEVSIQELTSLIANLTGFTGTINWDKSKPNGQPRRCVSYKRAFEKIGFKPETDLISGLKMTIEWFKNKTNISWMNQV